MTVRKHALAGDTVIKLHLADPLAAERGKNPSLPFESGTSGLELLLDQVDSEQQLNVLDLGSPNQAVVDMFYGMRVRLHMCDLLRGLGWQVGPELTRTPITDDSLLACLSHVAGQHYDAILAWDLLNYFSPDELQVILSQLKVLSHSGTLLHCLMCSGDQMPQSPSRLTPTRRRRLRYEPRTEKLVAVDPMRNQLMAEHLPGYRIADTARFGMIYEEQLREFKDDQSAVA